MRTSAIPFASAGLIVAAAWKPDKEPSTTACATWCVFDNGEKGHDDACTHPFKRRQCSGCDRCVKMNQAEADAAAVRRCEGCCGTQPSALLIELRAKTDHAEQLSAQLSELRSDRDRLAKQLEQLRRSGGAATPGLQRTQELTPAASTKAALKAATEKSKACSDALGFLRSNQVQAYATLALNTAPNSTLREVAGSLAGQIVARRPWQSVAALLGDSGGVHGIGKDRLHSIEAWATSYSFV